MCNWKNWIWPGIVATAFLTALTGWFLSSPVHQDLGMRAGGQLHAGQPWAKIGFNGRDGVISGIAENVIQQREAETVALSTYGVRAIENRTSLPDKADPFVLSMIKQGEGIALRGNFTDTQSRMALVAAAEKTMPGIAIKDELTLASGKPAGFDVLAAFAISQLAELANGSVSLSNLDYSIKGLPVDGPAYEKLTDAATLLPLGGKLRAADLSLPELGRPYAFSAMLDGSTVNLNGYAPSLEAKAAIVAKTEELFPGKTVKSALKLAGGAPDGFLNAAAFGLGQIAGLADGGFSLSGLNYSLKGRPADTASYDALLKAAKENLPAGMTLAAADLTAPPEQALGAGGTPAPEAKACDDSIGAILAVGKNNFEGSKAVIMPGSFEVLAKIAAVLNGCPAVKMEIAGHTGADGDDASNLTLSEARANAMRDMLMKTGVNGANIAAKGYGEAKPVAANDTEENRARNRRIEFRLVP